MKEYLEMADQSIRLKMDDRFFDDPYETYQEYRRSAPVAFDPETGCWMAFSHSAVKQALFNPQQFSSRRGNVIRDTSHRVGKTLGSMDPPQHDQLKPLILLGFKADRIQQAVKALLRDADHRLEQFEPGHTLDFVNDFSRPVLYAALGRMLGLSDQASRESTEILAQLFHSGDDPAGPPLAQETFGELFGIFKEQLDFRRGNQGDDLFSILIAKQKERPDLTDDIIIANMTTVLLAGNASIGHYFPNIIHALYRNPSQHHLAFSDVSLIAPLIEETVRWDTSTQCFARHVTEDVELAGTLLPAGARLVLFYASASRDGSIIPDADTFDIRRERVQHFGFGGGVHHCLGAISVRRFLTPLMQRLLPRIEKFELDMQNATRVKHLMVRGFRSLPMSLQ